MELVTVADEIREKGNSHFKAGRFEAAVAKYTEALNHLATFSVGSEEARKMKRRSRLLCLLNRAASNLKLSKWQEVIDDCSEVLAAQPKNVKALFRRAKAYLLMGRLDEAEEDIYRAQEVAPGNEELGSLLRQCTDARLKAASTASSTDLADSTVGSTSGDSGDAGGDTAANENENANENEMEKKENVNAGMDWGKEGETK
jgi:tetratricopeptide (TPR) repeat protein